MILVAFIVSYLVDNLDFWLWPSIRHGHVTCLSSHSCRLIRLFGGFDWQCWDSQCELATESRSAMDPWQFIFGQSGKIWLSFFQKQVGICQKTVLLGSSKVLKSIFFVVAFLFVKLCCDYVFGSPLKDWDRLLLYFRLPALRRLLALSRGLGLPIPKPFRAPFIPGITVRTVSAGWETMG